MKIFYNISCEWYDLSSDITFREKIARFTTCLPLHDKDHRESSTVDVEDAVIQGLNNEKEPYNMKNIEKGRLLDLYTKNDTARKLFEDKLGWDFNDVRKADKSGCPDIFWWYDDDYHGKDCGFIEVKSNNDSLRRSQIEWISKYGNDIENLELVYVDILEKKVNP